MKRNILYVVRSLDVGGLEQVVIDLANHIDKARYQSYICCIARAGELARNVQDRDSLFVIGNEGRVNIGSMKYLHDLVRRLAIDLVHPHNLPGLFYVYPAAKRARVPIVYTLHGYHRREERFVFRFLERVMSRSVDRFVCVSKELVPRAQRAFGVSGMKMRVIHNGIEGISAPLGETRERGRNVIIGSVGRVTYLKNYELLIEAFGDVLKIRPSCRLEIVGDGEAFGRIAGLVKALSLDERVTLHGTQLDVDRYLARFDIFALSSISEGHSIAILEALRLKKVCVVSAVGGNTEIIADGSNGYLFESGNKADLVRKLVFVIDNLHTPEMDRIRQQAVETIRSKFSREQMVAAYEHVYEELLGDRAAGAP